MKILKKLFNWIPPLPDHQPIRGMIIVGLILVGVAFVLIVETFRIDLELKRRQQSLRELGYQRVEIYVRRTETIHQSSR